MERSTEIKLSLILGISFFLHIFVLFTLVMPYYTDLLKAEKIRDKWGGGAQSRDIIVNINQDDKKVFSRHTLLSDKDSSAKGYLTREKGDSFLNNSLEFQVKKGSKTTRRSRSIRRSLHENDSFILTDKSTIIINLTPKEYFFSAAAGNQGSAEWTKIPDKNGIRRKNAIFYSNSGTFSFNTKKFKNFQYFRHMKNKIAGNWYPPVNANRVLPSRRNPNTNTYTPGYTRIMVVPSQIVKLYFVMNRNGDVKKVVVVDSLGNDSLDDSCVDAIKNSRNFGPVPADISGAYIVIPFMFGYYVR